MNGILNNYNIICDPYVGLGRYAIIRIPCDFIDCRNAVDLPWEPYLVPKDHPRYSPVTKFKYNIILGNHNDGVIFDLIDKGTHEGEYESVHKSVLYDFYNITYQTIKVGKIGAIYADDKHPHVHYMVKISSSTYNLQ